MYQNKIDQRKRGTLKSIKSYDRVKEQDDSIMSGTFLLSSERNNFMFKPKNIDFDQIQISYGNNPSTKKNKDNNRKFSLNSKKNLKKAKKRKSEKIIKKKNNNSGNLFEKNNKNKKNKKINSLNSLQEKISQKESIKNSKKSKKKSSIKEKQSLIDLIKDYQETLQNTNMINQELLQKLKSPIE